ncbi:MAG TPA: hypothetical protein VHT91_27360 [Kofleriaceae bacterium]|jgi:hypothetical protein|nr:hypothetical protein [Kofleriaceae bacterium]
MTRTSERTQRLVHRLVDYGTGPTALRRMRDETASLSEVTYDGPASRFAARISTYEMGSALLLEARMPQLQYDRSARHIAGSTFDHYLVVTYLRGGIRQESGGAGTVRDPRHDPATQRHHPGGDQALTRLEASAKDMGTMFTMELLTLAAGVGISVLSLSQLIRNYLAHTQGNRGFTDDLERFASHWREQEAVLDLFPVSAGRGRGRAAGARPRATRPR